MVVSSGSPSAQALSPRLLTLLACPVCGAALASHDTLLVCTGCARRYPTRPYLDLLPSGKRPPNEGPGDTAEMARRRVSWERRMAHAAPGEHAALERYVDAAVAGLRRDAVALDLGCGSGGVLRAVGMRLAGAALLLGLDISRPMIDASLRALRAEPRAVVLRASARRRLPLRDASIDVVLRRLAPALAEEVLRVLVPGGAYVTASFGPAHWHEAYDALPELPRPRPQREPAGQALLSQGFAAVEMQAYTLAESVTPADALDRLLMGPAAFHLDRARDLPRLQALAVSQGTPGRLQLTCSAEVTIARKAQKEIEWR